MPENQGYLEQAKTSDLFEATITNLGVKSYLDINAAAGANSHFALEVAKGNVPNHSFAAFVGTNPATGSVDFETMWDAGGMGTLDYDAQSVNFTVGLTVTGGTSSATGVIVIDDDDGATGTLTLKDLTGTFQNDEVLTDSGSGSATVDGTFSEFAIYVFPTVGEQLEIISDSANDDGSPVGTGARTGVFSYLDTNYDMQTETFTLNGTTAVTLTATDVFRPRSVLILTSGSLRGNEGTIVLRVAGGGAVRSVILPQNATTFNGFFTIPAGFTGFNIQNITFIPKNEDVVIRNRITLVDTDTDIAGGDAAVYQNQGTVATKALAMFPAKTDLHIRAKSTNTAVSVSLSAEFILVEGSFTPSEQNQLRF